METEAGYWASQPPQCWHHVFEGAAVGIEAISLDVGDQSFLPSKDRDRLGGRSRPYRRRDRGGRTRLP